MTNPLADLRTIDRLAGAAAMRSYSRTLPYSERHTVAHSAIALAVAEHANSGTAPTAPSLVAAGVDAIEAETTAWRRDHGLSAPRGWRTFWLDDVRNEGQPDIEVPPKMALREVFDALPARHQESLLLLALHDNPQDAATHAGISYSAMQQRIRAARSAFYALWWDWEPAPRPPFDRRASKPLAAACGRGHEYTPDNTRWGRAGSGRTKRACLACDHIYEARRSA